MNGPSFLQAMEVDTAGNVVWGNRYNYSSGAYHEAANIVATADGGYVMIGQYDRSGQYTDFDVYVVKTDALGQSGCNQASFTPTVAAASTIPPSAVNPFSAALTNTGTAVPAVVGTISTVNPTVLCLTAGINEYANAASIDVYPNPVKDVLNLSYKTAISNVKVINLLGQEVVNAKANTNDVQVDMSALNAGVYIVNVTVDDTVHSIKVIKE